MPTSVINNTAVPEIPAVIAKCAELLKKQGYPPYISRSMQSEIVSADFDYDSKACRIVLLGKGGDSFEIHFDEKMFPKGPQAEATVSVEMVRAGDKLQVTVGGDADGKEVTITLSWIARLQRNALHAGTIRVDGPARARPESDQCEGQRQLDYHRKVFGSARTLPCLQAGHPTNKVESGRCECFRNRDSSWSHPCL